MATVMVIDDSRATRALAKRTLVEAGYNVVEATDPGDAMDKARLAHVDVFVCFTAQPVELPDRGPADQSGKMISASLQPAQLLATVRKALA
jgi:CheY-like chemotaxis protein